MAVDIDSFKRDLDQLKNQRSVIQAKLDEANRHVDELMGTLKGMGFNSVEEAKQAYVKQQAEAEQQHALVKKLIAEIMQVDSQVPTREEVMERLNALSTGNLENTPQPKENPVLDNIIPTKPVEMVQEQVPVVASVSVQEPKLTVSSDNGTNNSMDLGSMLFASL